MRKGKNLFLFRAMVLSVFSFSSFYLCALRSVDKFSLLMADDKKWAKPEKPLRYNVLFLTIDSLRPDHLSCYGYFRKTSPNIDSLAEEGIIFLNAWSVSSWTSPSLVSIFSSLYPTRHGVEVRGFVLNPDIKTPVEVLADAGWKTYAQHWTGDTIGNLGFLPAGDDPIEFLRKHKDELFFAWFHLRGPHLPYNPPYKYVKEFAGKLTADMKKIKVFMSQKVVFKGEEKLKLSDREKKFVIALYDADVRKQDDELSSILDALKELGLWDKTIVVITSDHGEELFEHGWVGHASTSRDASLYNELIRIPLIIRVPGMRGPQKIHTNTSQVDIMPTLLEILGVRGRRYHTDGTAVLKFDRKNSSVSPLKEKREVFASTSPCGWQCRKEDRWKRVYALIHGDLKIIYYLTDFGPGRFELFRLPDEHRNIARERETLLRKMAELLFSKISYLKAQAYLLPPEPFLPPHMR